VKSGIGKIEVLPKPLY